MKDKIQKYGNTSESVLKKGKKMITAEWNIYNSKIKSLYGTSNLNSHIQQLNGVFKKQFIAKLQSNITKYPQMTSFADNKKPNTTEKKYMYI